MRNPLHIENIEEMRRQQGIEDIELHEDIDQLRPGDFVKVTLVNGPTSFETVHVRITSIRGTTFRGKLASQPQSMGLAHIHVGSPVTFSAGHIHSIPKGQRS